MQDPHTIIQMTGPGYQGLFEQGFVLMPKPFCSLCYAELSVQMVDSEK